MAINTLSAEKIQSPTKQDIQRSEMLKIIAVYFHDW